MSIATLSHALSNFGYCAEVEPERRMGERMRELRRSRGLTLEQVSSAMGITPQSLSQIELGVTKNIRQDNFLRFCAFFDVDPWYVVFGHARGKPGTHRSR